MTAQIWDQLAAIGKSAPWAWDELPPLPQGAVYTPALGTVGAAIYTFTADQMRDFLSGLLPTRPDYRLRSDPAGTPTVGLKPPP